MPHPLLVRPIQQTDFAGWKPLWDGYNAFYGRHGETALPPEITQLTWQRFFDPACFVEARNELELVSAAGTRRIDRMVRFDGEVWVLDYKRQAPAEFIDAYRTQVREYMQLVGALYPGLAVFGAIIDLSKLALIQVEAGA